MFQANEFTACHVYIITNKSKTVLYTGMSSQLENRLNEHRMGIASPFTLKYRVRYLLFFEKFSNATDAAARKKEIKGWRREKKIALIKTTNPDFKFLNYLFKEIPPSSESQPTH